MKTNKFKVRAMNTMNIKKLWTRFAETNAIMNRSNENKEHNEILSAAHENNETMKTWPRTSQKQENQHI